MTTTQLQTLKAAMAADANINGLPANGDGDVERAAYYDGPSSPEFIVWRTAVQVGEVMLNGFDWTRVDNLSVGKARIWEWLTRANPNGTFDASKTNIRAGIDETWKGTQADLNVRAAVYVHCKRTATRGEKLFATGTGSDAVPGLLVVEGSIAVSDVTQAREMA